MWGVEGVGGCECMHVCKTISKNAKMFIYVIYNIYMFYIYITASHHYMYIRLADKMIDPFTHSPKPLPLKVNNCSFH